MKGKEKKEKVKGTQTDKATSPQGAGSVRTAGARPDSPSVARRKAERAAARAEKAAARAAAAREAAERRTDADVSTDGGSASSLAAVEGASVGRSATATHGEVVEFAGRRSEASSESSPAHESHPSSGTPDVPPAPRPYRRFHSVNPLLDLPDEQRAKLFAWLRECPYDDAVQHLLRDQGLPEATTAQLDDFFQSEAEFHWEKRIGRAAVEANALVNLVERSPVRFSAGILAALGQEAFRQVASGQVEPQAMGRLATLFLKARSDERADQMQELKREKVRNDLKSQVDQALDKLAEEVDRNPVAREAFEALRRELAEKPDGMTELPN